MSVVNKFIKELSRGNKINENKDFEIVGNCFGFYSLKPGCGQSTMILELATSLSSQGIQTCIMDCNPLSNFYIVKALQKKKSTEEFKSIEKRFIKTSAPLQECIEKINDFLSVITFGYMQLSETFELDKMVLKNTISELKEVFDVVLLDIPNIPWVETSILAVEACSTLYTVMGFDVESIYTYTKVKNLVSFAGLDYKMRDILIMGLPKGATMKKTLEKNLEGINVYLEFPELPKAKRMSLEYINILDRMSGTEVKRYANCIDELFKVITNGINKEEVVIENANN